MNPLNFFVPGTSQTNDLFIRTSLKTIKKVKLFSINKVIEESKAKLFY
jgi:hypothetical protein